MVFLVFFFGLKLNEFVLNLVFYFGFKVSLVRVCFVLFKFVGMFSCFFFFLLDLGIFIFFIGLVLLFNLRFWVNFSFCNGVNFFILFIFGVFLFVLF